MSESAPAAPVEAPIRRAPSQAEMLRLANKEIETRQSISPAVAHVLTGSESERGRFHPDSNGELTQPEKDRLSGLSADGLACKLADEVSLRSREETKTDWNEWHSDLEAWTKNKFGQRFTEEDVTRLEVLQSVHLMSDTGDAQNKYLATVEEFRNQYFWDKDTGRPKSDIKQFVMDVAEGCKDENGNVDMKKLEARLNSVQELLVAFGEKTSADLMVRDFALSYGVLNQSDDMRQQVVDEAAKKIQEPVGDQEQDYLKALADQALTVRTTAVPPTPPAPQPSAASTQESVVSQQDPQRELRVEGKEGQPGFTIRMGGESIPGNRGENEDNYWYDARYMAGIVCDGMGGMGVKGEPARSSKVVRETMQGFLEHRPDFATSQDAQDWLRKRIQEANQALIVEKSKPPQMTEGSGTTLTVAFVWLGPNGERELITGNVGDSRLSAVDGNDLRDLTIDQLHLFQGMSWDERVALQKKFSTITDPEDRSQLTEAEYVLWKRRSTLSNAIDGRPLADDSIAIGHFELPKTGKIRIIGRTDGLTDVTTDAESAAVIKDKDDPQAAAHALILKAQDGDTSPRKKSYVDDKSVFVLDITIDALASPDSSETSERQIVELPRNVGVGGYEGQEYHQQVALSTIFEHKLQPDRSYARLDHHPTHTEMYITTTDNMYFLSVINPDEADNTKRRYMLVDARANRNGTQQGRGMQDLVGQELDYRQISGVLLNIGQPFRLPDNPVTGAQVDLSGELTGVTVVNNQKPVQPGSGFNAVPIQNYFFDIVEGRREKVHVPELGPDARDFDFYVNDRIDELQAKIDGPQGIMAELKRKRESGETPLDPRFESIIAQVDEADLQELALTRDDLRNILASFGDGQGRAPLQKITVLTRVDITPGQREAKAYDKSGERPFSLSEDREKGGWVMPRGRFTNQGELYFVLPRIKELHPDETDKRARRIVSLWLVAHEFTHGLVDTGDMVAGAQGKPIQTSDGQTTTTAAFFRDNILQRYPQDKPLTPYVAKLRSPDGTMPNPQTAAAKFIKAAQEELCETVAASVLGFAPRPDSKTDLTVQDPFTDRQDFQKAVLEWVRAKKG